MDARWIESWGGELRQGERPEPVPGSGEVGIDVEACGVGLTVLNCIRGDLGNDPDGLPRIPGHEIVGTISEVGAGVDPGRIGERVTAYFYLFCGVCERCLAGSESLCANLAGYLGVHHDGGYAERAVLPARNAIRLPDSVDPVEATAIPDAIATPIHVLERGRIGPGERVVVIAAAGGVGVHMVQAARLVGADVLGLEASERKLGFLEDEIGIEAADSSDFDRLELPARWRQPDVVVDLLGRPASLDWSRRILGPDGRMVVLTTFPETDFTVSPRELVFVQGSIVGSRYARRSQVDLAARLVAEGRIRPVVSATTTLEDVEDLHEQLVAGELIGRAAVRPT